MELLFSPPVPLPHISFLSIHIPIHPTPTKSCERTDNTTLLQYKLTTTLPRARATPKSQTRVRGIGNSPAGHSGVGRQTAASRQPACLYSTFQNSGQERFEKHTRTRAVMRHILKATVKPLFCSHQSVQTCRAAAAAHACLSAAAALLQQLLQTKRVCCRNLLVSQWRKPGRNEHIVGQAEL